MSCMTPVRTSLRTQRASESKRALFLAPIVTSSKPSVSSNYVDSSEDSCDLGIMSTIDTDSSDIDQFVPVTPHSWRPTSRTLRSSDRKKSVKEILKSPLTFKNYSSRHSSQSSISTRITDYIADTESCSSSLKDLRFHSDSDTSDAGTGNTPENRISKNTRRYPLRNYQAKNKENENFNNVDNLCFRKALKSLDFEQVMDEELLKKSPTKMLKTPHENVTIVQTPPRIHHKSMKDTEKSGEGDHQQKHPRLSNNVPAPKARLSLFGSGELKLSPKSFYPKSSSSTTVSDSSKLLNTTWPSKHVKSHRISRISNRKSRKRSFGEINKGVWHGIHKPKPKTITKDKALNLALKIIENSKLNSYIDEFMLKNKTDKENVANVEPTTAAEIHNDIQQVNQTLKQLGCDMSVETIVNNVTKANELAATFQVNKPIDLKKSLAPPKPVFDLNRSLMSNRSYDLNQSYDNLNRSTDLNMSFSESEMTFDDTESVMSDLDAAGNSRKIFKSRTAESRKAVVKMRNLKLEIDNGRIHLPQKRQQTENGISQIFSALENKISSVPRIQLDASDLLSADEDDESFKIPEMNAIESLLSQWKEEEIPTSEPQILNKDLNQLPMQQPINNIIDTATIQSISVSRSDEIIAQDQNLDGNDDSSSGMSSGPQDLENQHQMTASEMEVSSCINEKKRKLYPIFDKDMNDAKKMKLDENGEEFSTIEIKNTKFLCKDRNQYIIDAGQKKIGVTQCGECGVIYNMGDPEDERDHLVHHTGLNVLRFNGWKNERESGRWDNGRVIVVQPGDAPHHWRKVNDLLERVVHPQLGYAAPLAFHQAYKVYLYIANKMIVGCLVAETVHQAFRMLPGEDCISMEESPVRCGISRLWTHLNYRRQKIATRLVDCLRVNFCHGFILTKHQIAFSTPTPSGRNFATKYIGREDFNVYIEAQPIK